MRFKRGCDRSLGNARAPAPSLARGVWTDRSGAVTSEYALTVVVPVVAMMILLPLIGWGLQDAFNQTSGEDPVPIERQGAVTASVPTSTVGGPVGGTTSDGSGAGTAEVYSPLAIQNNPATPKDPPPATGETGGDTTSGGGTTGGSGGGTTGGGTGDVSTDGSTGTGGTGTDGTTGGTTGGGTVGGSAPVVELAPRLGIRVTVNGSVVPETERVSDTGSVNVTYSYGGFSLVLGGTGGPLGGGETLSVAIATGTSGATVASNISIALTNYNLSTAELSGNVVAKGSSYITSLVYGAVAATASYRVDATNTPYGTATTIGTANFSNYGTTATNDRSITTTLGGAYYSITTVVNFALAVGQMVLASGSSNIQVTK